MNTKEKLRNPIFLFNACVLLAFVLLIFIANSFPEDARRFPKKGFAGVLPVPPKVTVEKGMVVKFEGAPEQEIYFKSMIEKFGPDVAHIGEIMIGMNPHSPLNLEGTTHLQAHRRAGTVHIAYGNSVDDFRTVKPGIHIDNLIIKPIITLDGQPILRDGRLLMLDEPKYQEMGKKFGVTF